MRPPIELRDVTVRIGDATLLDGIDLSVQQGEWVALIGPNGAGKSTLLGVVAGLVRADGSVEVDGLDPMQARRRSVARSVALVPQTPILPAGMTVGDYVLLGRTPHLGAFQAESPRDAAMVGGLLARLDLSGMQERDVSTLSGGEQQRAVLGRALAQQADVLMLDEPTSALDIGHQQQVLELVDQLRTEQGLTVLAAMHDLNLAAQYADRLVVLSGGRRVAEGTARDVLTEELLRDHYGAHVRIDVDGDEVLIVPLRASGRAS